MKAKSPILIIVDHASNAIPKEYKNLELSKSYLDSHIAYDINIMNLANKLSKKLNSEIICGEYSRLFIDLNRGKDDPTLITAISDKKVIKRNINISNKDKKFRINEIYNRYHLCIESLIKRRQIKLLLSLHSFSPIFKGKRRNIEIGILSNEDKRYSQKLIKKLKGKKYIIKDNEPYNGNLIGDTLYKHGLKNKLFHTLIEIRNDIIYSDQQVNKISSLLSRSIKEINKNLFLYNK
jgi:predicted N-formylglutamate amidohydrolase